MESGVYREWSVYLNVAAAQRAGKGGDDRLRLTRGLFTPGQRICCAVSGGADSLALLLALREANAEREGLGIVLSAVHVHHGLRGVEADGDEAFVQELCARLAIPLQVMAVDTAARSLAEGEGLEEAARHLRYEVFRNLLHEGGAEAVATAHTLDDQAETVVMKFLRGAWTEGLGGISPVIAISGAGGGSARQIVRPLLEVSRAEVEAYLRARGQTWREDSSNRDVSLLRNRVRHELLPLLRGYNPRLAALLGRTAEIARDEEAFWSMEVHRVLAQQLLPGTPVRGGGRSVGTTAGERACALDVIRLRSLPIALARRVVRAAARSVGARLSSEETGRLLALAGIGSDGLAGGRIGSKLELGGLRAERTAREIRLWGHFGAKATGNWENFDRIDEMPE